MREESCGKTKSRGNLSAAANAPTAPAALTAVLVIKRKARLKRMGELTYSQKKYLFAIYLLGQNGGEVKSSNVAKIVGEL